MGNWIGKLVGILACPDCGKGPLQHSRYPDKETLRCPSCGNEYPVIEGVPHILPKGFEDDLHSPDIVWDEWRKKLENFILWRRQNWSDPAKAANLQARVSDIMEKFVVFTGLQDTKKVIIDIGCGDGNIRKLFGECEYFGVDPLLIDGYKYDFPVVRGVGERLPFQSGVFDAVILNQVLDHCNSIDYVIDEARRILRKNGTINIMQYISTPESHLRKLYMKIINIYIYVINGGILDTKTKHFSSKKLLATLGKRMEISSYMLYSDVHLFIKATI